MGSTTPSEFFELLATANQAYNIDTQGDMPTGCTSPYMVSVTATNNQDVRTFSGYGATTIDLAAPGDNVYLPSGSSEYNNTSMGVHA